MSWIYSGPTDATAPARPVARLQIYAVSLKGWMESSLPTRSPGGFRVHPGWCFPDRSDTAAPHLPAGRPGSAGSALTARLRLPQPGALPPVPHGAWYPGEDAAQPGRRKPMLSPEYTSPKGTATPEHSRHRDGPGGGDWRGTGPSTSGDREPGQPGGLGRPEGRGRLRNSLREGGIWALFGEYSAGKGEGDWVALREGGSRPPRGGLWDPLRDGGSPSRPERRGSRLP